MQKHICPFALWRPWEPAIRQPSFQKTQVILHTMVGNLKNGVVGTGATGHWKAKGLESTFIILLDGTLLQLLYSEQRADANTDANRRAISVETEDNDQPDTMLWTDAQVSSILKLIAWCHRTHDIPLRVCPAHDEPGIGYHTLFGESPRHNPWLYKDAKTCPGKNRKKQFHSVIEPRLASLKGWDPTTEALGAAAQAEVPALIAGASGAVPLRPREPAGLPQRRRVERRTAGRSDRRGRTNSRP